MKQWLILTFCLLASLGCFSQTYSARTDLTPQAYPVSIPCPGASCAGGGALSGANFQITPTDFSTPFVRITDVNTGGQAGGVNATAGYLTDAASSEVNLANRLDNRFSIIQDGNWSQLWAFDTLTKQATRSTAFQSPGSSGLTFSFIQDYIAYHTVVCGVGVAGCPQFDLAFNSYDTTCGGGIVSCNPTPVKLVDASTVCSIAALQGNSTANWQDAVTVSGDDQSFASSGSSTSGQGTSGNIYVIAWNRTNGCSYWNTATGQVFNNGVLFGTIAQTDRFYLHNVRMGKGGVVKVTMQPGTCQATCPSSNIGLYFWTPFTTTLTMVLNSSSVNACGHQAIGYNNWVNHCNGALDKNGFFSGPLSSPSTRNSLPSAYPFPDAANDSHPSWADDNSSDTAPFFVMFMAAAFAPADVWDNEILGVSTDGSGKVFRFAHTFLTPGILSFPPIAIFQSGKYALYTTDWNKKLGNIDGVTASCTGVSDCRTDVFLAILPLVGQVDANVYCPLGVPIWGSVDGPATLPLVCFNTALANTPATGAVVNVSTAGQLTTALAAATCGQKITLLAGVTYSGNFTIPALSCPTNNYLWIQSSAMTSLPPEGTRISPAYAGVLSLPGRPAFSAPAIPGNYMAQLITPNSQPALKFTAGTSGVRVMGIEVTRTAGAGGEVTELILTGNLGNLDHLIFDRIWCHGDENQDETNACFRTSAVSYIALIDSYANNLYCISGIGACTDAKVVGGGVNTTNSTTEVGIKIVNNFMEAAAETIIFGGGSSNTTPADVEIRLNNMFKPLTWNPSDSSYNGGISGNPVIVKNLFEMKNVQRLLLEGNTFTNVWGGFSQVGEAWAFTPKDQSGTLCPICKDLNLTLRYNTINSANQWGQFSAIPDVVGGGPPAGANNWSIHDNVVDNLRYATCYQCPSSSSTIQQITSSTFTNTANVAHDVAFNHNTVVYASGGAAPAALGLDGPTIASGFNEFNITFTNNLLQTWNGTTATGTCPNAASCSCGQTSGTNMINACWSPKTFGGNCFVANGSVVWPGSNVTSVASFAAVFVNYNNGNGGNYTLSANSCQGQGLDGRDPGANIRLLNSILAGNPVTNPTSLQITVGTRTMPGTITFP